MNSELNESSLEIIFRDANKPTKPTKLIVPPYLESLAQQILNQQKDYEIEVDFD